MIDQKGKTLQPGQTVTFDTWNDKAKNGPVRVPIEGKVESLEGEDENDQSKGDVVIRLGKGKEVVTVPALSVSVVS